MYVFVKFRVLRGQDIIVHGISCRFVDKKFFVHKWTVEMLNWDGLRGSVRKTFVHENTRRDTKNLREFEGHEISASPMTTVVGTVV